MENTRMVKVTKESELNFMDVKVSLQVVDGKIEAVTIHDGFESIRIVQDGTYSQALKVLRSESKVARKHVFIRGDVLGVEINKDMGEDSHEVREAARGELASMLSQLSYELYEEPLEIVEEEVLVWSDKIG